MDKTIDLLDRALEGGDSARELSRMLKLGSSTLSVARHRGRLSPTAAGILAAHIGLDPVPWIALAGAEAEPASHQKDTLIKRIQASLGKSAKHVTTVSVLLFAIFTATVCAPHAWPRGLKRAP